MAPRNASTTSDDFRLEADEEYENRMNAVNQADGGKTATMILVGASILQLPNWGKPVDCSGARTELVES